MTILKKIIICLLKSIWSSVKLVANYVAKIRKHPVYGLISLFVVIVVTFLTLADSATVNEYIKKISCNKPNIIDYQYNPDAFKILILPFARNANDNSKDIKLEQILYGNFIEYNRKENLSIDVIIDSTTFISEDSTASSLCLQRNVDLVIYGDYYEYIDSIKLKFVMRLRDKDSIDINTRESLYTIIKVETKIMSASPSEIINGKLNEFFEYSMYLSAGLKYYNEKKYYSCIYFLDKIKGANLHIFDLKQKCYYEMKDYNNYIKYNELLIVPGGYNVATLDRIGSGYLSLGMLDSAKRYFTTCIRLDSSFAFSYFNLALAYEKENNFKEAIFYMTKVLGLLPNDYLSLRARYLYYAKINKYDSAISDMEKCINMRPNTYELYYNYSILLHKTKRFKEAISAINRTISLGDANNSILDIKGDSEFQSKDYTSAISTLNKITPDYFKYSEIKSLLGDCYFSLGEFDVSLNCYSQAIGLNGNKHNYYLSRGWNYLAVKNYRKGIEDFEKATSIDPKAYIPYCFKAYALGLTGDLTNAIKYFSIALKLNPVAPEVFKFRGIIYFNDQNFRLALKDLKKAVDLNIGYLTELESKIDSCKQNLSLIK